MATLVPGGALLAVTKIMEPTLGLNLHLATAVTQVFISPLVVGFVLSDYAYDQLFLV